MVHVHGRAMSEQVESVRSVGRPTSPVTRGQMAAFLHRALPGLPEVRSAVDFADDDTSPFEADIEWLYSRGITQGTSATTFGPTSPVARGQMAAFLHRALGD